MTKLNTALTAAFGAPIASALEQWFLVDQPTWGRDASRRLDTAKAECAAMGAQ